MSRIAIHCRPRFHREHGHERQAQQVALDWGVHHQAEELQLRRIDRARRRVVGEPLHADEHPIEEELGRQRRHCQVQALDAQARDAEQDADDGRYQAAEQDRGQDRERRNGDGEAEPVERQVHARAELVGAIGADRHEGAAAERDLPAIPHQDIHADGPERQDQERDQDGAQQVLGAERPDVQDIEQRHEQKDDRQQQPERNAVLADREHRHVGGIAGLELAGFAIEHRSRSA